jgi:topoisomerase-4 subunit A
MGNLVTKYSVRKIAFKTAGKSTLGGVDIWYTSTLGRINKDEHGMYLGNFEASDKILVIYKTGEYELTNFELTNHYDPRQVHTIAKFDEKRAISCIYYDGDQKNYHIKRFLIETSTLDKKFIFITDHNRSELLMASFEKRPRVEIKFKKQRKSEVETLLFKVDEMIEVKGWKALGNKLVYDKIVEINTLNPEVEEEKTEEDEEVLDIVNTDIEENDDEIEIDVQSEEKDENTSELKLPDLPSNEENKSDNATQEGEQLGLF